jgi:hypothetical protein
LDYLAAGDGAGDAAGDATGANKRAAGDGAGDALGFNTAGMTDVAGAAVVPSLSGFCEHAAITATTPNRTPIGTRARRPVTQTTSRALRGRPPGYAHVVELQRMGCLRVGRREARWAGGNFQDRRPIRHPDSVVLRDCSQSPPLSVRARGRLSDVRSMKPFLWTHDDAHSQKQTSQQHQRGRDDEHRSVHVCSP